MVTGCSTTPSDPPFEAVQEGPGARDDDQNDGAREPEAEEEGQAETEGQRLTSTTKVATSRAIRVGELPEACRPPAGSIPRVTVGQPGGTAEAQWTIIRRVVRKNLAAFEPCGRPELAAGEDECSGHTFSVRLLVNADGSASARREDATGGNEHEACVLEALEGLTYPERAGALTLTGPVTAY